MKRIDTMALALVLCAASYAGAAQKPPAHKPAASTLSSTSSSSSGAVGRLGLTCAQILKLTSSDWIQKYAAAKGASADGTIQAIGVYGKCYDARTAHLAAALGRSGKGPLMGATGNFRDFDRSLKDFSAQALAATDPPADAVKKAYAALYEKQFRYAFYLQYEQKNFNPPPLAPEESAAFTKSKNHFGELLGMLPDEKIHPLHAAFGEIFAAGAVPDATKVAVYLYAIFLLESPTATPYSPPPF